MSTPGSKLRVIRVALDWTPNTNHTGLFVAKQKGWFEDAGLDVQLMSPGDFKGSYAETEGGDDFPTPSGKVAASQADFALNSPEGCIGWSCLPPVGSKRPKLKAVAALLQKQTSAIVTLKSSGLDRPSKLDGKTYASYAARFEGRIVQKLLQADGGTGNYDEIPHPFLRVWDLLKEGKADSTWVFMNWEGVEAQLRGVDLNAFYLQEYDIPYGYAPVLMSHPDMLSGDNRNVTLAFLRAAAKGYQHATSHPTESANLLIAGAASESNVKLDADLVHASQKKMSKERAYTDDATGAWGIMERGKWDSYLDWLSREGLLTTHVQSRTPVDGVSSSLDGLRHGNVGKAVDRSTIVSHRDVFEEGLLPEEAGV